VFSGLRNDLQVERLRLCIEQFYDSVYSNIGSYRRPPPLSRLGTGTVRHYLVV